MHLGLTLELTAEIIKRGIESKKEIINIALPKSVRWSYLEDCMWSCLLHLKKGEAELEKGDRVLNVLKQLPHVH